MEEDSAESKNKSSLLSFLKAALSPYFTNIDFKILIHQEATVFSINDLIIKKDVLKQFGIPLNLRSGKINSIKLSIENLLTLSPISLSITGVNLEVNSIYLTSEYQSDIFTLRQFLLGKWDQIHNSLLASSAKSFKDKFILNCISNLKLKVKGVKLVILDNTTISADNKKIKKLEVRINEITSNPKTLNEREAFITKLMMNIFKQRGDDNESMNIPDAFISPINIEMNIKGIASVNSKDKKIMINFVMNDPLIINLSKEKIKFLINVSKYITKAHKVQKYWCNRPEITKITSYSEGLNALRYAYKSIRDEYRKKLNKMSQTSYFQNAVNMERYTRSYHNHNFVFHNESENDKNVIRQIEDDLNINTVLHCREYVFVKILKSAKGITEEQKEILLKNHDTLKWLRPPDNPKISTELDIGNKLKHDNILFDSVKGGVDIDVSINLKSILINFVRKVKEDEIKTQMGYYHNMFENVIEAELKKLKKKLTLFKWLEEINEDELKEIILEEMKYNTNYEMENVQSKNLKLPSLANIQRVPQEEIKIPKANLPIIEKKLLKKLIVTIGLTNISTFISKKKNDSADINVSICSFDFIDHNFLYTIVNLNSGTVLHEILEERLDNENFVLNSSEIKDVICNSIIECFNCNKTRNEILKDNFLCEERDLLNSFEDQFKFIKCKKENFTNKKYLAMIFNNIFVKYSFGKKLLEDFKEKISRCYNKNQSLLHSLDGKNFKSSFVMRIMEKFISTQEHFEESLCDDLNNIFTINYLTLIKYIFTPLLPYFIFENKTMYIFYNNFSRYASIIEQFFRDQKKFLNVKLYSKGLVINPSTSKTQDNTVDVQLETGITINVSNETISELCIVLPSIANGDTEENISVTGNIYDDIMKTNMDVYDNFVHIKDEYFADENVSGEDKEKAYIYKRAKIIEKAYNEMFNINLKIPEVKINIFDNVYFISLGETSSINIIMDDISIQTKDLNDVGKLRESIEKGDDFILKIFCKTHININSFKVYQDNVGLILQTDFSFNIIEPLWKNIYFIEDCLIDIHSNQITITASPMIIKTVSICKNLNYYIKLYESLYGIASTSQLTQRLKNRKSNVSSPNLNQINYFTTYIEQLLSYDERVFPLKYYFINRISSSTFYSVGSSEQDKGIFFNVKVKEKTIFSIHIPLLVYLIRKSLFYEESQLWISEINSLDSQKKRFLQKLKVTFNRAMFKFNYYEYIFCSGFISSIGYDKNMEAELKKLNKKRLFDKTNFCVNDLNLVVSKVSYYYEETELKQQYKMLFAEKSIEHVASSNSNIDEIAYTKSNLTLNIERISLSLVAKNKQDIYLLIQGFRGYLNLCDGMLNNMIVFEQKKDEKEEEKSKKIEEPKIYVRKISLHTIDASIKKITLKIQLEETSNFESFGCIMYVKDLNYCENKNMEGIPYRDRILNLFYISSIKVFLSVPKYFRNRTDFGNEEYVSSLGRERILNEEIMQNLFDTLSKEENMLICVCVKNILLQQKKGTILFRINDKCEIGFCQREKIRERNDIKLKEVIFCLHKGIECENVDKDLKDVARGERYRDINGKYCVEVEINKNTVSSFYSRKRCSLGKKIKLFSMLGKMVKIISLVLGQNSKYTINLRFGIVHIGIPSFIFSYVYYALNYLKEIYENITKAFVSDKNQALKKRSSFSFFAKIESKNLNLDSNETEGNSPPKISPAKTIAGRKIDLNFLETKTNSQREQIPFDSERSNKAQKAFTFLNLNVTLLMIRLKQLEKGEMVPFTTFILEELTGSLNIEENKLDTPFIVEVKNARWKTDTRVRELIKSKSSTKAIEAKIYLFRGINDTQPFVNLKLNNINFIFVFKCVREIILFFEFNSRILDENPMKEEIKKELTRKKVDNFLLRLEVEDSSIIMPEDSQSANYLCINVSKGTVFLKRRDDNPRILISPSKNEPPPMIIDDKTIFNIPSISTKSYEYCLHTQVELDASDLKAFFCINKEKSEIANVERLLITAKVPSQDQPLTLMRKKLWAKEHKAKMVTFKPYLHAEVKGGIKAAMDKMLSLKMFADSNLDEPSNIVFLREPEPNFNDIELSFSVPKMDVNIDTYKCWKETVDEKDVKRIKKTLPGKDGAILYDDAEDKRTTFVFRRIKSHIITKTSVSTKNVLRSSIGLKKDDSFEEHHEKVVSDESDQNS